jgi:ribose 5-phosphate isomerase B
MCIVANKVKDVRASLCEDLFSARYSREHNNTNILTMGAWKISLYLAKQIVRVWLGTSFGNEENHIRRIKKITQEEKYFSK